MNSGAIMNTTSSSALVLAALLTCGAASTSHAQDGGVPAETRTPVEIQVVPYIWMTGLVGDAGARGLVFDVDESFGDVLESSDTLFGLMGAIDLRIGRFVAEVNGTYATAEFSEGRDIFVVDPTQGTLAIDADGTVDTEMAWLEAMAGWRFVEERFGEADANIFSLDAFGGLRYTDLQLDQTLTAAGTLTLPDGTVLTGGGQRSVNGGQNWLEPYVGARFGFQLGDRWEIMLRGDVGGFGIDDSDFSWQVFAGVGYSWQFEGWRLSLFGGYRALGQDYSDGAFTWDMVAHGPMLGAKFGFQF
jgi:opacity protein-like surface antigen